MKNLLFVFFLVCSTVTMAQMGVGTTSPNSSTILHLNANDKGVLLPNVSLINATDAVTIASPAVGLLVYNTNESLATGSGSGVGYYYNTGTPESPSWTRLATGSINVAKYIGAAGYQYVVSLGDFEFRYSSNTTKGYLQLRSTTGGNISTNIMAVESWTTEGYGVNVSSISVGTSWTNIGTTIGQTGEINTVYINVPSKNDVYRVTINLFTGPIEMLLVEKF